MSGMNNLSNTFFYKERERFKKVGLYVFQRFNGYHTDGFFDIYLFSEATPSVEVPMEGSSIEHFFVKKWKFHQTMTAVEEEIYDREMEAILVKREAGCSDQELMDYVKPLEKRID